MKIFIVAPEHINKLEYANAVVALNDDLNICKTFTSEAKNGLVGEYMFFLDIEDIILSFKNNALLFIDYRDEKITGITLDDFETSDIIIINTDHFNAIPDTPFISGDYLIVWLDSKQKIDELSKNNCIIESKYLDERINTFNLPMMYFIDEDCDEVAKIIIDYMNASEEERQEIIQENC